MRKFLLAATSVMWLGTGCAFYAGPLPTPDVTVHSTSGQIHTHINTNYSDWPVVLTGVELEKKNDHGDFVPAGALNIPCYQDNLELRVKPHGRAISGEVWYDRDVPSLLRHQELNPRNWNFSIDNYHDDGPHLLEIEVRIQNPGQRGYIERSTYIVGCAHRCNQ